MSFFNKHVFMFLLVFFSFSQILIAFVKAQKLRNGNKLKAVPVLQGVHQNFVQEHLGCLDVWTFGRGYVISLPVV